MMCATRFVPPVLIVLAAVGSALADPPVAATIPEPQPVAPTIPQPTTTVSKAMVNGVTTIGNYGSVADTKVICKAETPVGSRLGGHRVCMTKADWEKQSRNAQDYMNSRIGSTVRIGGPGG